MKYSCFLVGHKQDKGTSFLKAKRAADPHFLNIKYTENNQHHAAFFPASHKMPNPTNQKPLVETPLSLFAYSFPQNTLDLDCKVQGKSA